MQDVQRVNVFIHDVSGRNDKRKRDMAIGRDLEVKAEEVTTF